MITPATLKNLSLFSTLPSMELNKLAAKAADIRLEAGQWLIRETEQPAFFVVLEGRLRVTKQVIGRPVDFTEIEPGEFFGEVPCVFDLATASSLRALTTSRILRIEAQELKELLRVPGPCAEKIRAAVITRLEEGSKYAITVPTARVEFRGNCPEAALLNLRHFLHANRIPFIQSDHVDTPTRASASTMVDGKEIKGSLSIKQLAKALGFRVHPARNSYDVVVIGGGPGGLSAAVYGASEGLQVLLIERNAMGGQAGTSSRIENYLGFPNGLSGEELSQRALRQAERLGAELVLTCAVSKLEIAEECGYRITLDDGTQIQAKAVIVASGVEWRQLAVRGVTTFLNRGVQYGLQPSQAHAAAGQEVYIVGGGNSAGQAAMHLSNYARSVKILIRGPQLSSGMSRYLVDQLGQKANITVECSTEVLAVHGKTRLQSIVTSIRGKESIERKADKLFLMIGAEAKTSWLPQTMKRDHDGFIETGLNLVASGAWSKRRQPHLLESSLPGVFCVGDVRAGSVKRVASAVGEGSLAISMVHEYFAVLSVPEE